MKLVTWNVNGIRSVANKGFLQWLHYEKPDVLCLQEVKARKDDLAEPLMNPIGYSSHFHSAERPGYSGLAFYFLSKPKEVLDGLGFKQFDSEGRVSTAFFDRFALVNAYFPNSQRDHARLPYKLEFCAAMLDYMNKIRKKMPVILCGDFNIAHKEIDLKNPKTNINNAGFLPEERKWMDAFVSQGYVDIFRHYCNLPEQYTWWSYRPGIRERNIGWRLDYHCSSENFVTETSSCRILKDVQGSDHCPELLELNLRKGRI